jgi:Ser/Thr protein kinase RdoA (MazF antagonist)
VTAPRPARDILTTACEQAGLDHGDAHLIREHSNTVYLLPSESAVVRISRNEHRGLRARASLEITRWLSTCGVPVTEPLIDEAIDVDEATVTVWRYYPQDGRGEPPMRALGAILARLHALPAPPDLPDYPPLAGFLTTLADPQYRHVLAPDDLIWLDERAHHLLNRYRDHDFDTGLGVGLIHGDPYAGNCLWDGDRVVLGDWDEVSIGPRAHDLAVACHDVRFGASEQDLAGFRDAYGIGWDQFRASDGATILSGMRDLHTLTGYLRRTAHGDGPAARELAHRLHTLRTPADNTVWHAL